MDEKKPDPVVFGGPQDGAELDDVDKFTGRRLLADPEGGAARAARFLVAAGVFASLEEAAGAVAESMRKMRHMSRPEFLEAPERARHLEVCRGPRAARGRARGAR